MKREVLSSRVKTIKQIIHSEKYPDISIDLLNLHKGLLKNLILKIMQALRTIYKIENNSINISLPVNFKSTYVEVIILPYNRKDETDENLKMENDGISDFQKLLLNGPIMSDEDFNYFKEKQNHFNQWK